MSVFFVGDVFRNMSWNNKPCPSSQSTSNCSASSEAYIFNTSHLTKKINTVHTQRLLKFKIKKMRRGEPLLTFVSFFFSVKYVAVFFRWRKNDL